MFILFSIKDNNSIQSLCAMLLRILAHVLCRGVFVGVGVWGEYNHSTSTCFLSWSLLLGAIAPAPPPLHTRRKGKKGEHASYCSAPVPVVNMEKVLTGTFFIYNCCFLLSLCILYCVGLMTCPEFRPKQRVMLIPWQAGRSIEGWVMGQRRTRHKKEG